MHLLMLLENPRNMYTNCRWLRKGDDVLWHTSSNRFFYYGNGTVSALSGDKADYVRAPLGLSALRAAAMGSSMTAYTASHQFSCQAR